MTQTANVEEVRRALRERLGGDYFLLNPMPEGMGYSMQRATGTMVVGVIMLPRDPVAIADAIIEATAAP
jgi:hypothetical protein